MCACECLGAGGGSEERVRDKGGQVDVAVGIDPIEGSVWAMEKIQNSTEYM